MPGTVEQIINAIRETLPPYSRPLEGVFGQGIRLGVERALGDFLDEMEGKPPAAEEGGDIYAALGRWEAQEGRTIETLLAAYRIGARIAWREASAAGRAAGFDMDTLFRLGEAFYAYIDELSARSVAGFADQQSATAGEESRRRRALLTLLCQEPPAERPAVEAAAREAQWELPSALAALVWRDESEQPVARRLPIGSLVAALDDGLVCALVPDAEAPGRHAEIAHALGRRHAALGPTVAWPEAWQSARRARDLHRLMADGVLEPATLALADEHLAELMLHADGSLVEDMVRRRLAPLDGRSPAARRRLLETLSAWLDHHGSVRDVADALHVHPQTVRYRLAQLREVFGDELDDPQARFELALACRGSREDGA